MTTPERHAQLNSETERYFREQAERIAEDNRAVEAAQQRKRAEKRQRRADEVRSLIGDALEAKLDALGDDERAALLDRVQRGESPLAAPSEPEKPRLGRDLAAGREIQRLLGGRFRYNPRANWLEWQPNGATPNRISDDELGDLFFRAGELALADWTANAKPWEIRPLAEKRLARALGHENPNREGRGRPEYYAVRRWLRQHPRGCRTEDAIIADIGEIMNRYESPTRVPPHVRHSVQWALLDIGAELQDGDQWTW